MTTTTNPNSNPNSGQDRAGPAVAHPGEALTVSTLDELDAYDEVGAPQAEAAVLGALMSTTPDRARTLLEHLTVEDWTVPHHATVADAVGRLLQAVEPVDPVTVLGQLRRDGHDQARVSSRSAGVMLLDLLAACPCASSAGYYAQIVREHTYRRRIQQSAARLHQVAVAGALPDLPALIEREHSALAAAARRLTPIS